MAVRKGAAPRKTKAATKSAKKRAAGPPKRRAAKARPATKTSSPAVGWEGIKTRFRAIGRMVREAIKKPQMMLGERKRRRRRKSSPK
jgi:hypothetical protein